MDTFSIITTALADSANDPDKAGLDDHTVMVGRVLGAVQKVVDTLTPPDGGRYIVSLADISTAGTSLGERRITVSSKPLSDKRLNLAEKAVVMATFAAHEIGHTLVTRPRGSMVREHNHHSGFHAIANMADDIILEPFMVDRFPILADAFEFTGLWVLRTTSESLPKVLRMTKAMTTPERFNVVLSATRYGDIPEVVFFDTVTQAEKTWSREWARRLLALRLTDHDGFLSLCDEAWDHIRQEADEEPLPEEEQPGQDGDEPDTDEADEDDESEGGESTKDPGSPGSDFDDDEDDEDESDEGESGEAEGDDEDGDGGSDDAEDGEGDEGDESGESESEGGSEGDESDGTTDSGESMDEGDESDAEGEGGDPTDANAEGAASDDDHASGESGGVDGKGGGGNAEAKAPPRSEDDFAQDKVDQSMHEQSAKPLYDPAARQNEQAIRTYANTTVTAFGIHGTIPTEWS